MQTILTAIGNLRVTTKLMTAFGSMLLLSIFVSFQGLKTASLLDQKSDALFSRDLVGTSAIKEAALFQMKCTRILRDIVLASGDAAAIADQKDVLGEMQSSVDEWVDATAKALTDRDSTARLTDIRSQLPELRAISSDVVKLATAGEQKQALARLKQMNSSSNTLNLKIAEMCRRREEAAKAARAECASTYRQCKWWLVGCALMSVLFAVGLGLTTIKLIAQPLQKVMQVLRGASEGDLTQRLQVQSRDEIGRMSEAVNGVLESLRAVLENVKETARGLGSFSEDLAVAAEGMATGAREQSSAFEKTTQSLEQIITSARTNAQNALEASKVSSASWQTAQEGQAVVAGGEKAMEEINEASGQISQIVSAVDDVSFQTNLLAVNAAIEAARAGEQGQTFAVVAGEIRTLSRKSSSSASEIKKLVQESIDTVKRGSVSIHKSGQTLQTLCASVSQVTGYVSGIAAASEEQTRGVEMAHSAIRKMDGITQKNVDSASKLNLSATELSKEAQRLRGMLDRFTLKVEADSSRG